MNKAHLSNTSSLRASKSYDEKQTNLRALFVTFRFQTKYSVRNFIISDVCHLFNHNNNNNNSNSYNKNNIRGNNNNNI